MTDTPPQPRFSQGVLLAVQAALCFSMAGVIVKALGARLPYVEVILGRLVVGGAIHFWQMRGAEAPHFGHDLKGHFFMGLRGLTGLMALYCSFTAIGYLPLSDAVTLFHTNTVFAALLSALFLGERLGLRAVACLALALVGAVLVAQPDALFGPMADADPERLHYSLLGLASAVLAACTFVIVRYASRDNHHLTIVSYLYTVGTPVLLVLTIPVWTAPTALELLGILGLGAATQAGQIYITRAISLEKTGVASAAMTVQIVFGALLGAVFFAEVPNVLSVGGSALIVVATVVMAFNAPLKFYHPLTHFWAKFVKGPGNS